MKSTLRPAFEAILSRYAHARASEWFGKSSPVWANFVAIAAILKDSPAVTASRHVIVRWSAGQGRWATVPWIAALDTRETTKTSRGVYVIYLFRADLSGVYLTLNQGASSILAGNGTGLTQLRARATALRERSQTLAAAGFTVATGVDLRTDVKSVRAYEDSTAAYKLYERGAVPDDAALLADLAHVLTEYVALVPSRRFLGP
jgi:hypothetical protein